MSGVADIRGRDIAVTAMEEAAAALLEATADLQHEAIWIGRNALGTDPRYLRSSLASREADVNKATFKAIQALKDARV